MKLKYLATAAAAMIAASPAFAIIGDPLLPNSEMFLTVWSQTGTAGGTANASYTFDTGVRVLDMLANTNTNLFINKVVSGNADWASFLTFTGGNGLNFNVTGGTAGGAGDTTGNVAIQTVSGASMGTTTNLTLDNSEAEISVFLGAVNSTGNHSTVANGWSFATAGDPYFMNVPRNTWNGNLPQNSKAVGTTAVVGSYTQNGFGVSFATSKQFEGNFFFGQTTPSVYALQYQVAAVPEPTGYAMALAGLGLIGFVGSRRRKS